MGEELHHGVTDQVARSQAEHTERGQHLEWVDEVRQRLGDVEDHERPPEMGAQLVGCTHHVGYLDNSKGSAKEAAKLMTRHILEWQPLFVEALSCVHTQKPR